MLVDRHPRFLRITFLMLSSAFSSYLKSWFCFRRERRHTTRWSQSWPTALSESSTPEANNAVSSQKWNTTTSNSVLLKYSRHGGFKCISGGFYDSLELFYFSENANSMTATFWGTTCFWKQPNKVLTLFCQGLFTVAVQAFGHALPLFSIILIIGNSSLCTRTGRADLNWLVSWFRTCEWY